KMASLPFFPTSFLRKLACLYCKDLTRRPWRSMFWKNGKMFFEDACVLQIKVPQEKNEKYQLPCKYRRLTVV
ncbi:MAG: hypothetical protein IJM03_12275, partial [Treponema sp.]|nr:hypothetical protein [Treponema sp.]